MFRPKNSKKKISGPNFFKKPEIFYINIEGGGAKFIIHGAARRRQTKKGLGSPLLFLCLNPRLIIFFYHVPGFPRRSSRPN